MNFSIPTAKIHLICKVLNYKTYSAKPLRSWIFGDHHSHTPIFRHTNRPNQPGFVVWRTGAVVIRVTLTMIGKAAITYSFTLVYLYTPEIYPTVVRGAGLGVASMMSRIGGVVAPLIADLVSQLLFAYRFSAVALF